MTNQSCAFGSMLYTKSRKDPNHSTEEERLLSYENSQNHLFNKYYDMNDFFLQYNVIGENNGNG